MAARTRAAVHAPDSARSRLLASQHGKALPAVILGVDPGERSGWSLWAAGRLTDYGACSPYDDPAHQRVVRVALTEAADRGEPLIMVTEAWGQRWRGLSGAASAMGARKLWERSLAAQQRDVRAIPAPHVVRAHVATWRSSFGGRVGMTSERAKGWAMWAVTRRRTGAVLREGDHDIAEAILIGEWGTRARPVADVIPGRVLRAWAKDTSTAATVRR